MPNISMVTEEIPVQGLVAVAFVIEEGSAGIVTTTRWMTKPQAKAYNQFRQDISNKEQQKRQSELKEKELAKGITLFQLTRNIIRGDKPVGYRMLEFKKSKLLQQRESIKDVLRPAGITCTCDDCLRNNDDKRWYDKELLELDIIEIQLSRLNKALDKFNN